MLTAGMLYFKYIDGILTLDMQMELSGSLHCFVAPKYVDISGPNSHLLCRQSQSPVVGPLQKHIKASATAHGFFGNYESAVQQQQALVSPVVIA